MRDAAEHAQARALPAARDALALPQLNADATIVLGLDLHAFAPVLPAFFLSTSPVYRTPFCLYGSGLRRRRMFAATCPTSWRSTPVTVMCVCLSIATSIPDGMSKTTACE